MSDAFAPIIRRFRLQLGQIGFDANRNWALRRILYLLWYIQQILFTPGDAFTAKVSVGTHKTFIRAPEPMANRTIIANIDTASPITIFEDGVIVAVIAPGTSRRLPLCGRLTIEARVEADQPTFLMITTERRCPAGDPYYPPYGKAIEPIGGDIL